MIQNRLQSRVRSTLDLLQESLMDHLASTNGKLHDQEYVENKMALYPPPYRSIFGRDNRTIDCHCHCGHYRFLTARGILLC